MRCVSSKEILHLYHFNNAISWSGYCTQEAYYQPSNKPIDKHHRDEHLADKRLTDKHHRDKHLADKHLTVKHYRDKH